VADLSGIRSYSLATKTQRSGSAFNSAVESLDFVKRSTKHSMIFERICVAEAFY
jgi:hypothetical protein